MSQIQSACAYGKKKKPAEITPLETHKRGSEGESEPTQKKQQVIIDEKTSRQEKIRSRPLNCPKRGNIDKNMVLQPAANFHGPKSPRN